MHKKASDLKNSPVYPSTSKMASLLKFWKINNQLVLMLIPGLIVLVCFKIGPLFGMIIALQDFSAFKGIMGSTFVGLKHFRAIFADPYMGKLIKNTVLIAVYTIVFSFPIPIIFSLFLNEVRQKYVRNPVQSLNLLPYFISSAVMVSILYTLLSPSSGLVNQILNALGRESIFFTADPKYFRSLYVLLNVWQSFGYSSIVYMASITAIDPAIYESADIDGANRWAKMYYITLPSITGSIVVMLIISIGNIFSVDLDRILLMYNPSVYETADVIQTYVYRLAFASTGFPDYSYGTAVNFIQSIITFILVVGANWLSSKYKSYRLF